VLERAATDARRGARAFLAQPANAAAVPESDDAYLNALLQEYDVPGPRLVEGGYHGHDIAFHRGHFFIRRQSPVKEAGEGSPEVDGGALADLPAADSLEGAREVITQQVVQELGQALARTQAEQEELRSRLREAQARADHARDDLLRRHQALAAQLAECQRFVCRVRQSWLFRLRRRLAQAWTKESGDGPQPLTEGTDALRVTREGEEPR
jgi:hypothetical protein